MESTLTHDEKVKGWTSFHSYIPDWFTRCNNRFMTIKNGQLWLHNDESNPIRNNLYGVQQNSKIETVINIENSQDKIFKTLTLEGTHAWDTDIETNLASTTITKEEFNKRESRYFAYMRRNENVNDLTGGVAQGLGVILDYNYGIPTTIQFNEVSSSINIGDSLYQINNGVNQLLGVITDIQMGFITIQTPTLTEPVNGLFCFAIKNSRIEGGDIRGYYAKITLEQDTTEKSELFAIESNIIKSYV